MGKTGQTPTLALENAGSKPTASIKGCHTASGFFL